MRATDAAGGRLLEFVMTAAKQSQIVTVADTAALAEAAARRLLDRINHGDRAAVCLTGGSSSAWVLPLARG